jgi:hypothetical protein
MESQTLSVGVRTKTGEENVIAAVSFWFRSYYRTCTTAWPEGSDNAGHSVRLVQATINTLLISVSWRPIFAMFSGILISVLTDNNSPFQSHKHTLAFNSFSVKHRQPDIENSQRQMLQLLRVRGKIFA